MKRVNLFFVFSILAITVLFSSCTDEPEATDTVKDKDGNVYHTVTIGTQVWMVENLRTTRFNDGTLITKVTDNTQWSNLTSPAYCWYDNDSINNNSCGALYNWYTVNTGKLAPRGWHIPTDAEWTTLKEYVSANLGTSSSVAKAIASTGNWDSSTAENAIGNNSSKNNSTGFSALPAGYRYSDGQFVLISALAYWWIPAEYDANNAWFTLVFYHHVNLDKYYYSKKDGMSVRCVKD